MMYWNLWYLAECRSNGWTWLATWEDFIVFTYHERFSFNCQCCLIAGITVVPFYCFFFSHLVSFHCIHVVHRLLKFFHSHLTIYNISMINWILNEMLLNKHFEWNTFIIYGFLVHQKILGTIGICSALHSISWNWNCSWCDYRYLSVMKCFSIWASHVLCYVQHSTVQLVPLLMSKTQNTSIH